MAKGALENSARLALRKGSFLLWTAFSLSFLVNVLRLSGPLFMILIYDRVLTSRSEETLFSLFAMVAVLMIVLGFLDYARKRIVARFAAQFQERLEHTILGAATHNDMFPEGRSKPAIGLDESDSLRGFFHSGGLLAVMDFVWAPMFVAVVFFLHPTLGYVCLAGMLVMLTLVMIRIAFLGGREERANASSKQISDLKNMVVASRQVVRSQDMSPGFKVRWTEAREGARDNAIALRDWTAWFDQMSQTTLLLVRYGVLAAGAYLALQGQLTVGAMVASMFLVTRALIPVNRFVGEIPAIIRAFSTWARLKKILAKWDAAEVAPDIPETSNPRVRLSLSDVSVRSALTGAPILRAASLKAAPGTMIEIIGSSGQGKTVLGEAIVGLRPRSAGTILCDGHNIARLSHEAQAKTFGYVPETPAFIAGTLAENISRMDPDATESKVASAARKACMHAWIIALPDGYNTRIDPTGSNFSKGQRQQLALARALYHLPRVLVIDEPDAMLLERLPKTMKKTFDGILQRGGVIVLMARKPLALQHARDRMLLENGKLVKARHIPVSGAKDNAGGLGKVTVLSEKKATTKTAGQGGK